MASFMEDFYYGNINPQARGSTVNSEMRKKVGMLSENEELLNKKLTGEEKKLFNDYISIWSDVNSDSNLDSFMVGFKMGAKFTYDTFVKDKT